MAYLLLLLLLLLCRCRCNALQYSAGEALLLLLADLQAYEVMTL
jgi:hypothetical protein